MIKKIDKYKFPINGESLLLSVENKKLKTGDKFLEESNQTLQLEPPVKMVKSNKGTNNVEILPQKKPILRKLKSKLTNAKLKKSNIQTTNIVKSIRPTNSATRKMKMTLKSPAMGILDHISPVTKFSNLAQESNRRTKSKSENLNLAQKVIKKAFQSASKPSKASVKVKNVDKPSSNFKLKRNSSTLGMSEKVGTRRPVVSFVNKMKCVAPVKVVSKTPRKVFNQDKEIFPNPTATAKAQQIKGSLVKETRMASKEKRLAHRCRLAVQEGQSNNLHQNKQLLSLVLRALDEKISWPKIQKILRDTGSPPIIGKNCFLLQMKYKSKISVLVTVRTKNIQDLKTKLKQVMKMHGVQYDTVLDDFKNSVLIEALASYRTQIKFPDFEKKLSKDAIDCKANFIEIIDYETGAVNFKCNASDLPSVTEALEQRDYKILYSDYGFQPKDKKYLATAEHENYQKFIRALRSFKDIDKIYDNCRNKNNLTVD